ncbi:MAG: serine/threonine protein phosphatase [Erythrobacter sp.]|nr:serine/threonine protein phosphatase [Erythrobacter sp.]NCQ63641.1 serine/threonine protein phosphatase [Alphaproteobacteria bacterium]
MLNSIRTMLRKKPSGPRAATPPGTRFYAIGDIHGCDGLFAALIDAIEADDAEAPSAQTTVVLLGDLVDRGPDSAQVIDRARKWGKKRTVRYLAGNHEEMFLESFDDLNVLRHFLKHGGRETILSYGMEKREYNRLELDELQQRMHALVPRKHRDFLAGFEEMIQAGDYAFVHAGIEPTRALDDQARKDLLWIRERFLGHSAPFEKIIVHGHTIFEDVDTRPNRIGVDTGAYRHGRLTALVLEGETRRYIQASERPGKDRAIAIEKWDDTP